MTPPRKTTIDVEGGLRFTFDERWLAVKWDDSPAYREGLHRLETTKAADIVAAVNRAVLWLVEVKDPRGFRTTFKEKAKDLHKITAAKTRDTLAGAIWSIGRDADDALTAMVRIWLTAKPMRIGVVLWLEGADAAQALAIKDGIESELRWLNPIVVVTNRTLLAATKAKSHLEGMEVVSLPGAPTS